VGALYIRDGVRLAPLMHGAGQEGGLRPGTENVLLSVGLGAACAAAERDLAHNRSHFRTMRDRLHRGLTDALGPGVLRLNGHPEHRLPNTLSVAFRGVEANTLLAEVGDRVAASAGAACHADEVDVSAVIEAMHVPTEWAMGTVRFSVGRGTTAEDIDRAVDVVAEAVRHLLPHGTAPAAPAPEAGPYRRTRDTQGMGCAGKLRPQALEEVLRALPPVVHPDVLVGPGGADDAAVYRLRDDLAVVQTVDFFTPIVDDPYLFGAIAAANALSDLYAMGARPLFGLNIVGFPSGRLPMEVLHQILRGASDKAEEAGLVIVGGHTVEDPEPKYGLAVTGTAHPDHILRNSTARPGDALILTKPLGTGIIATAVKRGLADESAARKAADLMATLNRTAAEAMLEAGVHACTDVTGFGLLGHLHEMAAASGVDARLDAGAVPILADARTLSEGGIAPGGTHDNLSYAEPHTDFQPAVSRATRLLLADAQTSGGLLISLPEERADALLELLHERGIAEAAQIGTILRPGTGRIEVTA
jgi:selenium donor protein